MFEPIDRLREPLTRFLRRHRDQILAEWQLRYCSEDGSSLLPDDYGLYPQHLTVRDITTKRQLLMDTTASYLTLCMEWLEENNGQKGSEVKLSSWIDETREAGLRLPDVVESLLNLKRVVSGFVMDRLYYRPMEVKNLNQVINTIFDHVLLQLSLAYSSDNGKSREELPFPRETDRVDIDRVDIDKELRVLSTISHELHTPLTSIIGYAEGVIENLDECPDQHSRVVREDIEKVLKNAYYLMDIIRNSMEWSKLEVREASLKPESFDLKECVLEVLTTISTMLTEKGIRAVVRSSKDIPRPFGDYSRTRQVLLNLLSNAIKYTPSQGKIAIEIAPFSGKEGNGNAIKPKFIKVTVIDNGIGIDREKLPYIFKEFGRANNNDNGDSEGIGLGLFIAKRLVELQGGRIWLKSQPKKGSRFSFTLPTVHNSVDRDDVHYPNIKTATPVHLR